MDDTMEVGRMCARQWNVLNDTFDSGARLRETLLAQMVPPVASRGVYVHVDYATNRVIRVGIATGTGGILARWSSSHWRAYRYWAENHLQPGTHSYPGFFRGLNGRPTRLYWTHETEKGRAAELEQALIQKYRPAWETYRAEFSAAGQPAKAAVAERRPDALDRLELGPARVAECIQGAGLWQLP